MKKTFNFDVYVEVDLPDDNNFSEEDIKEVIRFELGAEASCSSPVADAIEIKKVRAYD